MKTTILLTMFVLSTSPLARCADGPALQEVARDPANYADQKLEFKGVTLSGDITRYEVAGIRNYYLTVSARNVIAPGLFVAPARLADRLGDKMNSRENYSVNLTCKIEKITPNGFDQWQAVVSRVVFLDSEGKATATVEGDKK